MDSIIIIIIIIIIILHIYKILYIKCFNVKNCKYVR
jgi:hypothetical protein